MTTETIAAWPPNLPQAARLHLARYFAGLEIKELAQRTGISRGTIRSYEKLSNHAARSDAFIKLWAQETGAPLEWLLTGEAGPTDGPGLTLVAGPGFEPGTSGLRARRARRTARRSDATPIHLTPAA